MYSLKQSLNYSLCFSNVTIISSLVEITQRSRSLVLKQSFEVNSKIRVTMRTAPIFSRVLCFSIFFLCIFVSLKLAKLFCILNFFPWNFITKNLRHIDEPMQRQNKTISLYNTFRNIYSNQYKQKITKQKKKSLWSTQKFSKWLR